MSKKRRVALIIYMIIFSFALVVFNAKDSNVLRSLRKISFSRKEACAAGALSSCTVRVLREGTKEETPLFIITSFEEGPVVFVIGGVHGDEPAGFMAAEDIATWAIDSGTLLVLPSANQGAICYQTRTAPEGSDLNRVFPGSLAGNGTEQLAAEIYQVMTEFEPDWVIDLHEAQNFEHDLKGALGQTFLCPEEAGAEDIMGELIASVNRTVLLDEYRFTMLRGVAPGSLAQAASHLGAHSLIIETCQRMPLEERIKMHRQVVSALLYLLGVTVD